MLNKRSKKIIFVANARIPTNKAHGAQIMQMCKAFADKNIQVELVMPRRKNTIKQGEFEFYHLAGSFKITRLPCLSFEHFGFTLQTISFFLVLRLYLLIQNYSYVYSRDYLSSVMSRRVLLELHHLPNKKRFLFRYCIKRAHAVFTITNCMKKELVEITKINKEKTHVLPTGIDIDRFCTMLSKNEARVRLGLPENVYILGYCGKFKTMGMSKGLDELVKALSIVREKNLLLYAIGADSDAEIKEYADLASLHDVKERVRFAKHIKNTEVPLALTACDALVMNYPSNKHYNCYMSPVKMFEYMASKRPIITSRLPSVCEILDEESALFHVPSSIKQLASSIRYACDNKDEMRIKASNAYDRVRLYTWSKRIEKVLKTLH